MFQKWIIWVNINIFIYLVLFMLFYIVVYFYNIDLEPNMEVSAQGACSSCASPL